MSWFDALLGQLSTSYLGQRPVSQRHLQDKKIHAPSRSPTPSQGGGLADSRFGCRLLSRRVVTTPESLAVESAGALVERSRGAVAGGLRKQDPLGGDVPVSGDGTAGTAVKLGRK